MLQWWRRARNMQFVEGSYVAVCYLASKTERYSKTDYHRFGWKKAPTSFCKCAWAAAWWRKVFGWCYLDPKTVTLTYQVMLAHLQWFCDSWCWNQLHSGRVCLIPYSSKYLYITGKWFTRGYWHICCFYVYLFDKAHQPPTSQTQDGGHFQHGC